MARATEAASAVNALLSLSSEDQDSLLEVIGDYFTFSEEDSDSEDDSYTDKPGIAVAVHLQVVQNIIKVTEEHNTMH